MGGFVSETLGKLLAAVSETKLKNAPGLNLTVWAERLVRWGGKLSLVSGVFVGLWDTGKVLDEAKRGDYLMGAAYVLTGLASVSLAIYGYLSVAFGPIGWFLLGAVLLITLWIETHKDNKLQEWLSRSYFGAAPSTEKYADHVRQLSEYELATK